MTDTPPSCPLCKDALAAESKLRLHLNNCALERESLHREIADERAKREACENDLKNLKVENNYYITHLDNVRRMLRNRDIIIDGARKQIWDYHKKIDKLTQDLEDAKKYQGISRDFHDGRVISKYKGRVLQTGLMPPTQTETTSGQGKADLSYYSGYIAVADAVVSEGVPLSGARCSRMRQELPGCTSSRSAEIASVVLSCRPGQQQGNTSTQLRPGRHTATVAVQMTRGEMTSMARPVRVSKNAARTHPKRDPSQVPSANQLLLKHQSGNPERLIDSALTDSVPRRRNNTSIAVSPRQHGEHHGRHHTQGRRSKVEGVAPSQHESSAVASAKTSPLVRTSIPVTAMLNQEAYLPPSSASSVRSRLGLTALKSPAAPQQQQQLSQDKSSYGPVSENFSVSAKHKNASNGGAVVDQLQKGGGSNSATLDGLSNGTLGGPSGGGTAMGCNVMGGATIGGAATSGATTGSAASCHGGGLVSVSHGGGMSENKGSKKAFETSQRLSSASNNHLVDHNVGEVYHPTEAAHHHYIEQRMMLAGGTSSQGSVFTRGSVPPTQGVQQQMAASTTTTTTLRRRERRSNSPSRSRVMRSGPLTTTATAAATRTSQQQAENVGFIEDSYLL